MASVIDFDPQRWLEEWNGGAPANLANVAKEDAKFAALAETAGAEVLPEVIRLGLRRLASSRPRGSADADAWRQAVGDALRLAADGWGSRALAAGWEPLHLWGLSADAAAFWLRGRRIVAVTGDYLAARDGNVLAWLTKRPLLPGTAFLWEARRA